jgi:hypothetical protein
MKMMMVVGVGMVVVVMIVAAVNAIVECANLLKKNNKQN